MTLAAPAAQLHSLHAVLYSVRLTFSSKDALVHLLMLSMYCILGRPFFFSLTSFRECKSLQDYTYCFCMHVQRKTFFFDNLSKEFASSLNFFQYNALVCPFLRPAYPHHISAASKRLSSSFFKVHHSAP